MEENTNPKKIENRKSKNTGLFKKEDLTFRIIEILDNGKDLAWSLQHICDAISATSNIENAVFSRISFRNQIFQSRPFEETKMEIKHDFRLPDNKTGLFELFISHKSIIQASGSVIEEAESILKIILPLIVALLSKIQLEKLTNDIEERQKELKSINRTTEILQRNTSLEELLQEICSFLPEAMQFPLRYCGPDQIWRTKVLPVPISVKHAGSFNNRSVRPNSTIGAIEIYYLKEFPEAGEGPFLTEERNLIDNLAALISGSASKKALEELLIKNTERLKELGGINRTTEILKSGKSLEESLRIICSILPESWQFPEHTVARISYDKNVFTSAGFRETPWKMIQSFEAPGRKKGIDRNFLPERIS